jgi:tRNA-dependent cyclodipeptide synthase
MNVEQNVRPIVLYLEDRAPTAEAWVKQLTHFGFDVHCATTIEQAKALWTTWSPQIAVAMLDIDLSGSHPPGPHDGGLQIAEMIAAQRQGSPVAADPSILILTSFADNAQFLHRAMRAGVEVFLFKEPSQGPAEERDEHYRIESYVSALCIQAQLRSPAVRRELTRLQLDGFHGSSSFRRLAKIAADAFQSGFGARPWYLIAQGAHGPAFVAGYRPHFVKGSGLQIDLPHQHPAYGDIVRGLPLEGKDPLSVSLRAAETIRLLSEADGATLVLGLFPVPPAAIGPERSPLLMTSLVRRIVVPELTGLATRLSLAANQRWAQGARSEETQREEIVFGLLAAADEMSVPYFETKYPTTSAQERIRVRHGALCAARLIRCDDQYRLLLFPEFNAPDMELIRKLPDAANAELVDDDVRMERDMVKAAFIDQSLEKSEAFSFPRPDRRAILSVDARDFERLFECRYAGISKSTDRVAYSAKMAGISPVSAGKTLKDVKQCFLGISLENEKFDTEEMLAATVEWIGERFAECRIIIGDKIHRHTLRIRDPALSDSQALEKAIRIGGRFCEEKAHVFEKYSQKCKFHFVKMSEFTGAAEWERRTQDLRDLAVHVVSYATEVERFADAFVLRQDGRRPSAQELDLARSYLLEEAAFCGMMSDEGWRLLVYPGPIDPFKAISDGKIPEAPECLRQLQFVSLKLKKAS